MEINASVVGKLRKQTGISIMMCKKALLETEGNFDRAVNWLKEKANLTVVKSSQDMKEGLVAVKIYEDQKLVSIIELNSGTDFVARSEKFIELLEKILSNPIKYDGVENFLESKYSSDLTVKKLIQNTSSVLGEVLVLRRAKSLSFRKGLLGVYVHKDNGKGQGNISVVVLIKSKSKVIQDFHKERIKDVADQIAMHIAATNPLFVSREEASSEVLLEQRKQAEKHAQNLGKSGGVLDKMVKGREEKFLRENSLLEQKFIVNDAISVSDLITKMSKELGLDLYISEFIRFELGQD